MLINSKRSANSVMVYGKEIEEEGARTMRGIKTGFVRIVDDLGRVSIPAELRRRYNFNQRSRVEIEDTGEGLHFSLYANKCTLCGSDDLRGSTTLFDKPICENCIKAIYEKVKA